jgi:DNA polymerase III subunit delta
MADLKPVYLVYGEDESKLDAWRARVKKRAGEDAGAGALEELDAASASPEDVAAALGTLTFAIGRRYLLVEGVEGWKAGALEPLEQAMADVPPDTVLVLLARAKVPKRLADVVKKAGGAVHEYGAPKPWELPGWVVERAREEGLQLDPETAKALIAAVGTGQQRLLREIEKLAISAHPSGELSIDDVERLAAGDAAPEVYALADAIAAGDATKAVRLAEALRDRDDRPSRLLFTIVRRLREVHEAVELLDAGVPDQTIAAELKLPPWLAKRIVAQAKKADRDTLERALCVFADLEIDLRGADEHRVLDEDTAFTLALDRAAPG